MYVDCHDIYGIKIYLYRTKKKTYYHMSIDKLNKPQKFPWCLNKSGMPNLNYKYIHLYFKWIENKNSKWNDNVII